eukprot:460469-Pelagomonas_calceolata.AAC.1
MTFGKACGAHCLIDDSLGEGITWVACAVLQDGALHRCSCTGHASSGEGPGAVDASLACSLLSYLVDQKIHENGFPPGPALGVPALHAAHETLQQLCAWLPRFYPDRFAYERGCIYNRATGDCFDTNDPAIDPLFAASLLVQVSVCGGALSLETAWCFEAVWPSYAHVYVTDGKVSICCGFGQRGKACMAYGEPFSCCGFGPAMHSFGQQGIVIGRH